MQKPTDEQFNDNFNEDFDFGEGETKETSFNKAAPPSGSKGPNKKLLIMIAMGVIIGVSFYGYKYYSKNSTSVAKSKTSAPTATPAINPSVAITPPPITASPIVKKEENKTELKESDLAKAFSQPTPPVTPTPPAVVPPPPVTVAPTPPLPVLPTPATEALKQKSENENIQEIQKELFNPVKPPVQTGRVEPQPLTPPPPPPTPPTSPKQTGEAEQIANLSQALDKLYHQMDYNLSQVRNLDAYTRDLSQTLTKLNQTIKAMDQRLSTLTNTTTTLSKEMGSVRNQVSQAKQMVEDEELDLGDPLMRRKAKCAVQEEQEYVVHAVIPGRAWLKSGRGQIITVTEGEVIGNYGKILVIDAANSVVLTSSGITFR